MVTTYRVRFCQPGTEVITVQTPSISYHPLPESARRAFAHAVHETSPAEPPKPRLLDRVREALRTRHYSRRTEKAYVAWIRRYILFHRKRHPLDMGAPEITRFLSALAVDGNVAASTQNQALSALVFLYREVLDLDVPWLDDLVRAKRPIRLPIVLTREEVGAVLQPPEGVPRLMAYLLYGAGLRVLECCRLRVQDVDFARNQTWCATPRAPRIGRRCSRTLSRRRSSAISTKYENSTSAIFSTAQAGSSFLQRSRASIRTPAASGYGNGCFRRRASTPNEPRASGDATISTSRCSSAS